MAECAGSPADEELGLTAVEPQQLCFLLFVPHILDSQAIGRNKYLDVRCLPPSLRWRRRARRCPNGHHVRRQGERMMLWACRSGGTWLLAACTPHMFWFCTPMRHGILRSSCSLFCC